MRVTIDTSQVHADLLATKSLGQGFRKALKKRLESIEANPSSCPPLDNVPPDLSSIPGLVIRKARVINGPNNWRIIYAHWTFDTGEQHVDLLFVFNRPTDGYPDFDAIQRVIERVNPAEDP